MPISFLYTKLVEHQAPVAKHNILVTDESARPGLFICISVRKELSSYASKEEIRGLAQTLKGISNTANTCLPSFHHASKHCKSCSYRQHRAVLCDFVVEQISFPVFALLLLWLFSVAFIAATETEPANSHHIARVTSLKLANNAQTKKIFWASLYTTRWARSVQGSL